MQTLGEFSSGARPWNQWRKWLAINAARLAKQLDRDQFERLKENPQDEIPKLLNGYTASAASPSPTILCDPIEKDPSLGAIIADAEAQAIRELGVEGDDSLGTCQMIWAAQKRILREQHDIEWRSPAEMNPDMRFD